MDLREYSKQVREIEEEIPDLFVFLTSKENKGKGWIGGSVAEVARHQAARFIADDSHRISTPQEVAAYKARQQVQIQKARESEATKLTNVLLGQLQAIPAQPLAAPQQQQQPQQQQPPAQVPVADQSASATDKSGGKAK